MRKIKNEFPHPVLINECEDYVNCTFKIQNIASSIDNDNINIEIQYDLTSKYLSDLVSIGKSEILIKVSSTSTSYRKIFPFQPNKSSLLLQIPKNDVAKTVEFAGLIVAKEPIEHFSSEEHNKVFFESVEFEIRKGDIIAYDDGFILKLDDSDLEAPVVSIFTIAQIEGNEVIQPDFNDDKIIINLNKLTHEVYQNLRKMETFRRYLSAVIVLPVLVEAIDIIKGNEQQEESKIDEDLREKRWYDSIKTKIKKKEISYNESSTYIANKLLGDIVQDALSNFKETIDSCNEGEIIQIGGND